MITLARAIEAVSVMTGISFCISTLANAIAFASFLEKVKHRFLRRAAIYGTLSIAIFIAFMFSPSASYLSGLRLSAESKVAPQCAGAPVLWLGSSAAIIRCHDSIRVYRALDQLVMRQGDH
ncbi:hypothetical protein [Sphingomonas sp.]|uniref:hypothetical protein n=1 Tax=Sphingomonas sp. TaxID=28214 RepID=UPI003D6CEB5B